MNVVVTRLEEGGDEYISIGERFGEDEIPLPHARPIEKKGEKNSQNDKRDRIMIIEKKKT